MVKIVPFDKEYLAEAARLFSVVYSDKDGVYPVDLARVRIEDDLKSGSGCSYVAVDENGNSVGMIICKKIWGEVGWELYIDSIQVEPTQQRAGVGRKLMAAAVEKAKSDGATGVAFPVDTSKPFPASWYESMGFEKTRWTYFSAKIGDLKI